MDIKLLTREEVVALTDEQIKRYVDYACAEQGIKMFPAPIPPINPFSLEKAELGYKLPEGYVKDRGTIDAITALLAKTTMFSLGYDHGWEYKYLTPVDVRDVASDRFYLKADLDSAKDGLRKYTDEKAAFEKHNEEYKKAESARRAIVDEIYGHVWEVQREARKIEELKARAEEYKAIANGNEELAKRFLIKAYPEAEQLLGITITSIPAEQPKVEEGA